MILVVSEKLYTWGVESPPPPHIIFFYFFLFGLILLPPNDQKSEHSNNLNNCTKFGAFINIFVKSRLIIFNRLFLTNTDIENIKSIPIILELQIFIPTILYTCYLVCWLYFFVIWGTTRSCPSKFLGGRGPS